MDKLNPKAHCLCQVDIDGRILEIKQASFDFEEAKGWYLNIQNSRFGIDELYEVVSVPISLLGLEIE